MKALMALAVVSMVLLAVIPAHAALDDNRQTVEEFYLYLPQANGVITVTDSAQSAFDRR